MPLLCGYVQRTCVLGGYFVGVGLLGVDDGAFWSQMQTKIDLYDDVLNGVIKVWYLDSSAPGSLCFRVTVPHPTSKV